MKALSISSLYGKLHDRGIWFGWGGSFFLFMMFFFLMLIPINDYDIWYHLVIGRRIAEFHSIPSREFYIYTMMNDPAAFHEWGFGLLYYIIYNSFGFTGMAIINAFLGAGICFMLYKACGSNCSIIMRFLFCGILLFFVRYRLLYRPENFLFLAMALEVYLLEHYLDTKKNLFLAPLPLICFLLNQVHPSALFVLFIFAMYAIQSALQEELGKRTSELKKMSLFFMASFVFSLLNPYGYAQTFLPLSFGTQKQVLAKIQEFVSITQSDYFFLFVIFVLVTLPAIFIVKNRWFVYSGLFLAFSYLAYKYARNFALLTIIMYVPLAKGYDMFWQRLLYSGTAVRKKFARVTLFAGICLIYSFNVFLLAQDGFWGTGVVSDLVPVKSAQYLKHNPPHGNVFNYYPFGGYLGWMLNGLSVFIDGRHYTYDRSWQMHDTVLFLKEGWDKVLQEYDVDVIIIPSTMSRGEIPPVVHYLGCSDDWLLVVDEAAALAFRRNRGSPAGIDHLDKKRIWMNAIRSSYSSDARTMNLNLGLSYFRLHRFREAYPYLKAYQRYDPSDREITLLVRLLERSASGDADAVRQLEAIFNQDCGNIASRRQ